MRCYRVKPSGDIKLICFPMRRWKESFCDWLNCSKRFHVLIKLRRQITALACDATGRKVDLDEKKKRKTMLLALRRSNFNTFPKGKKKTAVYFLCLGISLCESDLVMSRSAE